MKQILKSNRVVFLLTLVTAALTLLAFQTPLSIPGSQIDPNSIREVKGDMPPGWELIPQDRDLYLKGVGRVARYLIQLTGDWHRPHFDLRKNPVTARRKVESVWVRILILRSSAGAQMAIDAEATGPNVAMHSVKGTYSEYRSANDLINRPCAPKIERRSGSIGARFIT